MTAHSPNSENSDPTITASTWPSQVKSPPPRPSEEEGLENIRIPNKENLKESNKPVPKSKKTCICAPTTHAGSFRCHLHRTNKSPLLVQANIAPKASYRRPPLSRFCTAASGHQDVNY